MVRLLPDYLPECVSLYHAILSERGFSIIRPD